jgi:hypothetical protein
MIKKNTEKKGLQRKKLLLERIIEREYFLNVQ